MRAGDETFYDVLGVPEDATRAEIEAAYRERVKETHPDAADVDDTDAFRRVVRAEEVLGDPDERDTYDTLGHEAYLRTVDGHDTSTTEHAEWTTGGEGDPATTGRQDAGTSGSGYTGFRDFERHDATVDEGRADPGERGVDPGGWSPTDRSVDGDWPPGGDWPPSGDRAGGREWRRATRGRATGAGGPRREWAYDPSGDTTRSNRDRQAGRTRPGAYGGLSDTDDGDDEAVDDPGTAWRIAGRLVGLSARGFDAALSLSWQVYAAVLAVLLLFAVLALIDTLTAIDTVEIVGVVGG